MAKKARTVIGTPILTAIADRGYFKGEEILACHEVGIFVLVPPTKTSGAKADGRFDKADFIYDPQKNEYRCPAGQAWMPTQGKVHSEHESASNALGAPGRT